jgi:hypothetical protein
VIVIATHEGQEYIGQLLESWNTYGTNGHDIAVVETGGSSQVYLDHLNDISLTRWNFNLSISRTPYKGYDTGAYLWAYENFQDEESFLFMHDSLVVKRPKVMYDFLEISSYSNADCVAWLVFRQNDYENQEQVDHVKQFVDDPTIYPDPGFGIFGPIFYTERRALASLDPRFFQYAIPKDKNQQEANERGWPAAFRQAGVKIGSLDGDFYASRLVGDQYSAFRKFLPRRL